jgi:predicted glycoside hydrolase/deacetylase ChbG (UPF0249 family)
MVRWTAARDAVELAQQRPALSVGLHLDLGEWAHDGDGWRPLYERVHINDEAAVAAEVDAQLAAFEELLGRRPTHLDSHQHVHLHEPVRSTVLARGAWLRIPVRGLTPEVAYCGAFYGQVPEGGPYPSAVSLEGLLATLAELPEGLTELACHPASELDFQSSYARERAVELRTLCHPEVRRALPRLGIELRSFAEVPPPERWR